MYGMQIYIRTWQPHNPHNFNSDITEAQQKKLFKPIKEDYPTVVAHKGIYVGNQMS